MIPALRQVAAALAGNMAARRRSRASKSSGIVVTLRRVPPNARRATNSMGWHYCASPAFVIVAIAPTNLREIEPGLWEIEA
jgi:hypothetical protein